MNTMKLHLWFSKKDPQRLIEIEKAAALTHQKNISKIVQSRKKVDKLKEVLEQNNITISIAKAAGH